MFALSLQNESELKSTVRPNGIAAQAFEPDSGRKNRIALTDRGLPNTAKTRRRNSR
jgi:hypothetical protein